MKDAELSGRTPDALDLSRILDALPPAIVVARPDGEILYWNGQAEDLYGWRAEEVIGRNAGEILVSLTEKDEAAQIMEAVRSGSVWRGDFTVLRRDGNPIRVWSTDKAIHDESGEIIAIVGASEDVSEQRLVEQRTSDLTERLRLALEAGRLGTFRTDIATGLTEWDPQLEALFGHISGSSDPTMDLRLDLVHPDDRQAVRRAVDEGLAARGPYSLQYRVVWPDGSLHWIEASAQPTFDADGNVTGNIGCARDVTEQVEAAAELQRLMEAAVQAAEQERVSRERLEFLASINDALTRARDRHELMANVTEAAVPRLGEWCSIFVLPHRGAVIPEVVTAHVDPSMVAYALELQERFPYDPTSNQGMPEVIRTATPQFFPAIDDDVLESLNASQDAEDIVRDLGLSSSIAVPLVKWGHVLGGLQVVMTKSRRSYTPDDLTLLEAVAARVASSLENMRLLEEQRAIATTLQASLLPQELPAIDGLDVAVRYWASGEGIEVGGDFYDLFQIGPDHWGVVIGDVCGKGPSAAAVTGMARHTIATAAWHGDDHVGVLTTLNQAMAQRFPGPFCTVAYGTLRPRHGGFDYTFVCGGHPLPILVRSDGSVQAIGRHGSLIGAVPKIDVATTSVDLGPGDTIVLYTDGVTDVAPPHYLSHEDFALLVAQAAAATSTAEELADQLHADLSKLLAMEGRADDIALLILRSPTTNSDRGH